MPASTQRDQATLCSLLLFFFQRGSINGWMPSAAAILDADLGVGPQLHGLAFEGEIVTLIMLLR